MSSSNDIKCKVIEEELRSVWPDWHVAGRLGGGAFGDVFQIYRDNHGIRVDSALKVIQVDSEENSAALLSNGQDDGKTESESQSDIPEALLSEIQIMEALRGAPNIVAIEDFYFKKDGSTNTLFVRMELLTSLEKVLPGRDGHGTLSSIREIIKLGRDVCRALVYCEKKDIIHRDIKPANLFRDEFGDYKVGDFGASKRMDTIHVARTMTGIGTVSYMAPEIFQGRSYNNTVDIYALGLVLYQFLNKGRIPFLPEEGSYTTQDIDSANFHRLHGTPVPSLAGKAVGEEVIDSRLDAVVRKACAMDPADRYQTAEEFYDALEFPEMEEKKPIPVYAKRPQGSLAPDASLQKQQERTWSDWSDRGKKPSGDLEPAVSLQDVPQGRGKSRPEEKTMTTQLPDGSSQGRLQKAEKRSGRNNIPVIIIVILLIIAVAALAASLSGRGSISDSWEEIIAAAEDGTYIDKYKIGDTKKLDLGKEGVIEMELVAFDADELADGSGKASMTWIAKDFLNTEHVMYEKTKGGWPASDLRRWLRESVLPLFPETVRSNIREVKKYSFSLSDNGTISSSETIWIPSTREMFKAYRAYEDKGTDYLTAFPDDASRQKQSWWWLRTSSNYGDDCFCYAYDDGSGWTHSIVRNTGGVVIGFCLGSSSLSSNTASGNDKQIGSEEDKTVDETISDTEPTDAASEEDNRDPGPISDSWEEIVTAGEKGTYINKYKIGDTKELDLGEEGVIEMELVAFDEDELADGSGKAPMTWIAKNPLNTEHVMNEELTNAGGWPASEMRAWLQESVFPLFPEEVRSDIREVKKYSYSYSDSRTISSIDKIWIPSEREMFGADGVNENKGPEYMTVLADDTYRQKQHVGVSDLSWWFLRSAADYGLSFTGVCDEGSYSDDIYANNVGSVVIGFCLGSSGSSSYKVSKDDERAPGPITDSWEEISAAGEDGTYIDRYKIGDTKELDLGEEGVIEMELVAFDEDELADGSGKAPMTWIAKNLLNTEYVMNEGRYNEGGWPASDMRAWLQESVLSMFPEEVRLNIREVKKYSFFCSYSESETISSIDTIWIPSRREVFGMNCAYEDKGPEYIEAFPDDVYRKKQHTSATEHSWWLRSNTYTFPNNFSTVTEDGFGWYDNPSNTGGVAIGFCY